MSKPALLLLVAFGSLAGCAAPQRTAGHVGAHSPVPERENGPKPDEKREPVAADAVENAALPFHGIRVSDGAELGPDDLLDELARADAICIGEDHDGLHDHFAELRILAGLLDRAAMSGREVGLGIEMLPRGTERAIDAWRTGQSDDAKFLSDTDWDRNWGWDYAYYRPILELAKQQGIPIVPLNARHELTRQVARHGLSSLKPEQEKRLPELDMADAEHRAWFERQMKEHPSPHFHLDSFYAAQVVWDETMAESAAHWLAGRLPGRQLVILAGAGHCRTRAIPKRIARRGGARVVNVRPLVLADGTDPRPTFEGYDLAFAMTSD